MYVVILGTNSLARSVSGMVAFMCVDLPLTSSQVDAVSNTDSNSQEESESEDSDDEFPLSLYMRGHDGGTMV